VLYTLADVPLDAGRLIASQVSSTTLQEHQRRCQKQGFDDDGQHAPALSQASDRCLCGSHEGAEKHPRPQKMDEPRSTEGRRKRDRINRVAQPADHSQPEPRADCAVQKFKRSSAAVATNREGHRFPRSGKAERLRGKPLNEADV